MTEIRRFLARLLTTIHSRRAETELAREINAHLRLLEDEHVAKGLSRDDARLAARRAFGGVEQTKEHQRDARGFRWLEDLRIDLQLGVRMLVKYPGLSIIGGPKAVGSFSSKATACNNKRSAPARSLSSSASIA
jgi:hypothetical protein